MTARLKPVLTMSNYGNADYLRGLVNMGDNIVMLLDIDKLLGGDGMSL
jgi:chemotaxis signal transduction protein